MKKRIEIRKIVDYFADPNQVPHWLHYFKRLILGNHMSMVHTPYKSFSRKTIRSLVFCAIICISLLVLLYIFFWSWYFLSCFSLPLWYFKRFLQNVFTHFGFMQNIIIRRIFNRSNWMSCSIDWLVFNTYLSSISDISYCGQIIVINFHS